MLLISQSPYVYISTLSLSSSRDPHTNNFLLFLSIDVNNLIITQLYFHEHITCMAPYNCPPNNRPSYNLKKKRNTPLTKNDMALLG